LLTESALPQPVLDRGLGLLDGAMAKSEAVREVSWRVTW
jgi:hypothetical protein